MKGHVLARIDCRPIAIPTVDVEDIPFTVIELLLERSEVHHIPCAIVGPELEPGVNDRVASQADLFPTILDVLGWEGPHASCGRSLLEPADETGGWAMCVKGELVTWIESAGWVQHNLDHRTAAGRFDEAADLDLMERRLLSMVQVVTTSIRSNRVTVSD